MKKIVYLIISGVLSTHLAYADKIAQDPLMQIISQQIESKPLEKAKPKEKETKTRNTIGNMLLQSISLMGIAYKWGGNTPNTGMDCSGFVRYVFQKSLGIDLPRTAAEMARVGKQISINELEPGDLIFFNTQRGSNTHIGIYLGNGKFIQSPRTGETIQISDLKGYWTAHFNGAKRIVEEDEDSEKLVSYTSVRNQALPVKHYYKKKKSRRNYVKRKKATRHYSSKKTSKKSSATKKRHTSSSKRHITKKRA